MTVFALNYTHAAGVSTLGVEPVCLADAGGQTLVGKYLQLAAQGDVNDFVHGIAPFVFPMHPTELQLGASVKISVLHHAHCPIHISGQVTHFVDGVLPGWLAWFRVLTSGEHGQFQSWRGDRNLWFALYPLPGIDPRRS